MRKITVVVLLTFFLGSGSIFEATADNFTFTDEVKAFVIKKFSEFTEINDWAEEIIFGEVIVYSPNVAFLPVTVKEKNSISIPPYAFAVIYYNSDKWAFKGFAREENIISEFPKARDQLIDAGYF